MKGGKNPNRFQKKLLESNGMKCEEWLFIQMKGSAYVFRNRTTNEVITLDK